MERPKREKVLTAADLKRKAELEELKATREGKKSRLENMEFDDEDNVYELMDDDQYGELVRQRRQREDFVVDDEGLGYYDDGEEHFYEDGEQNKATVAEREARRKAGVSSISTDALRKARKMNMLGGSGAQAGSLFRYVQKTGAAVGPAHQGGGDAEPTPKANKKAGNDDFSLDIDAQLSSLLTSSSKPGHAQAAHSGRTSLLMRTPAGSVGATPSSAFGRSTGTARVRSLLSAPKRLSYHAPMADGDDAGVGPLDDDLMPMDDNVDFEDIPRDADGQENGAPKPKSRFQRQQASVKTIDASVPVARKEPKMPDGHVALEGLETALPGDAPTAAPNADSKDTQYAVGTSTSSMGKVDLKSVVKEDDTGKPYVQFYWIDAYEQNGTVYLFGKVEVEDAADKKPRFVSACAVVEGVERELLVLPRRTGETNPDGTDVRFGLQDVYREVQDLLIPSVIPRDAGKKFKMRPVKRKYAFELDDVPREETEYLQVLYSAQHGYPDLDKCEGGGRFFERIFGARTPALEHFLLSSQLMGPSWLRVYNVEAMQCSPTHCKVDFRVPDPSQLVKLTDPPPSPTLTVLSLSLKTAVNPSTQLHEVVAVSTLTHPEVQLDGPTDLATTRSTMRQITAIRPLGQSAGPGYPSVFPHDMAEEVKRMQGKTQIVTMMNERALLSWFFTRLQVEDPDVLTGHNIFGFDIEILLTRAVTHKLAMWSKLGRLVRNRMPQLRGLGKDIYYHGLTAGRLLCDTYLSAREHLRETTYSLANLAKTQLNMDRTPLDAVAVPAFYSASRTILQLAQHTALDAQIIQRLAFRLQILPLTKQLTNISGNVWARTLKGARAERIEYLLMHEFRNADYVTPEKAGFNPHAHKEPKGKGKKGKAAAAAGGDEELPVGDEDDGAGGSGFKRGRQKPSYAGGLVLEPKKGLYDSYILLLDFNSLYPSIIQEYNLCFSTINWSKYVAALAGNAVAKKEEEAEEEAEEGEPTAGELPPLPDPALGQGVLPRVIKSLVERRGMVKRLMKTERDKLRLEVLDIRQKALKLTANSMYGCLGFSHSRFFAKPIAALVTAMGRETLSRTVDIAQTQLSLEVIYGDTDSVMINTGIASRDEFAAAFGDRPAEDERQRIEQEKEKLKEVRAKGALVKNAVNKLYKSLELELDGIFKCMLLLKKKKYAALTVAETASGGLLFNKELKGLDLVRRDWCPLSKKTGHYVIDQILSGENRETVVANIHGYLEDLAKRMREGEIEVAEYAISKGLNKAPHEYPDAKAQPHLQVALAMIKKGQPVKVGDIVQYVVCEKEGAKSPADRAFHPEEVAKCDDGSLKLDVEWYLAQQILPPIARLCEPIEGTSQSTLAERLGLDKHKFGGGSALLGTDDADDPWGFTPMCRLEDAERFKDCVPFTLRCTRCRTEQDFSGVFHKEEGPNGIFSGLICPNRECRAMYWGAPNAASCFARFFNRVTLAVRTHVRRYYDCWLVCDDGSCARRTQQQSVLATVCLSRGCHGHMNMEYNERALHTQLKYLETLFDVKRARERLATQLGAAGPLPKDHIKVLDLLFDQTRQMVSSTAYNWIRPSLWTAIFGGAHKDAGKNGGVLTIGNGDASSGEATGAAIFGNSGASMVAARG